MAKVEKTAGEMSFLDHLEELRWHFIRATFAVVIAATAAFFLKVSFLIFCSLGRQMPTFSLMIFFAACPHRLGWKVDFVLMKCLLPLQSRTMGGQFSAHVWTAITAGFIIAFPYILYEFWKFISPRYVCQ